MDEPGPKAPRDAIFQARSNEETFLLVASTRNGASRAEPIAEPPAPPQTLFILNLFGLIVLGVLFCGWTLRYTDWFPVIGGILTLGGALSWLAFVSQIVPEDELGILKRRVFGTVFQSKWTLGTVFVLSLLMLVGTSLFGTVQIEPLQQTVDRQVWIQPVQGDGRYDWNRERDFDRLSVGGTLRALRFSGWSGARYLVKVSGYPAKEVQLRSWQRSDLFLPSSFRRPVVLLRPGRELGDVLVKNPMRLEVVVSGVTNAIDFNGNAIWIGCDDDVQVPAEMVEGWERGPNRGWANVWLPAQALDNIHVRLREQETIRFRLFRQANDELYVEKVCLVRAVPGNLDFQPQEEEIDARKNN